MATIKVANSDDTPQSASLFTSQISSSNLDFTLNRLKLHLVQNLVKKVKVLSGPLPPLVPLPLPILCPHHTFLASLILTSMFTQDQCYSNKAWAKLSGLPPREISRCKHTLGDALDWRLWVGKTLLEVQWLHHHPTMLWSGVRVMGNYSQATCKLRIRVLLDSACN